MKQISVSESKMSEAMTQIEGLDGLSPKEKGCLRLLTEEMFSMCRELLDVETLDFNVGHEGKDYTLKITAKTHVDEEARKQFLSMSSSGRNTAYRGVKGLLSTVVEAFNYDLDPATCNQMFGYGFNMIDGSTMPVWSLSNYIDTAPQEEVSRDWDEMEKSIIANFADDVEIGARSNRLEITVTKKF